MANAFERLHIHVKQILWDMRWSELRPFQAETIHAWFDTTDDLVVMANTAAGKTEAAFLPIISTIASTPEAASIRALYVGPLKALINDQFHRLEDLCQRAQIPVHRWHGDVGSDRKKRVLKNPSGILLITPESLEAVFMRSGRHLYRLFPALTAVVIDEMHVFLESERGRQLASLLTRLDAARSTERTRRLGLSATIGDKAIAQEWLAGRSGRSAVIESREAQEIQLLLSTFVEGLAEHGAERQESEGYGLLAVAEHILERFCGQTNLVFCNRKEDVETLADLLRQFCGKRKRPNEFLVHHGSLSKDIREHVEEQLQGSRPCTAVCSSTLELGIDVGDVSNVGQVGPPHGVNSLKQRLGRSGRRGDQPARVYIWVPVQKCGPSDLPPDHLYPHVVQSMAIVSLLIEKWLEPPTLRDDDLSTLIQQTLSIIVQQGGAMAADLFERLCVSGPFTGVTQADYVQILRDLGNADLLEQTPGGDLILGLAGERLCGHYDFYAAFETPESYQVVCGSDQIGNIDGIPGFYMPHQYVLLAGRRWEIIAVDEENMLIEVRRAKAKQPVKWFGGICHVHPRIRERMRDILADESTPSWLEETSRTVLRWGRDSFQRYDLASSPAVRVGSAQYIFTWTGDRANKAIELALRVSGLDAAELFNFGLGVCITRKGYELSEAAAALESFTSTAWEGHELVTATVGTDVPPIGKHTGFLSPDLRARAYASEMLDIAEGKRVCEWLTQMLPRGCSTER